MPRQRNSTESIPEPLQIDCGSNPNSTSMDQPFYGNNVLLNSVETPTLADYLLSPNNTDIDYLNMPPRETDDLNIWDSREPNTSICAANHQTIDLTKMDEGWATSLSINSAGSERNNIMTLDSVELNLNNTPAEDGQSFTQKLNSSHQNQGMEDNDSEIVEVSLCPFLPEFFESGHPHSLNSHGSSSNGVGQALEDDQARISVDGQRISCKRKSMEGATGESSTSCNMPSSFRYLPTSNFLEANQTAGFSPLHRGVRSDWNAETPQRNFRARLFSPACQQDMIPPFQSHSAVTSGRLSTIWASGDSIPLLNSYNSSTEQSHPHMLAHNAYSQIRLNSSLEETSFRSFPRNGTVEQSAFITRSGVGYLGQDTPTWNPTNSSLSMSGNRPNSSSAVIQSPGSIRAHSEMVPAQFHRNLSEVLRSSLFPSVGSESGHQSVNLPSRQASRTAPVLEAGQSSRTVRQVYSPLYPRPSISIDRQRDAVSGLPLSARSRDGRNRMISEIRNALDLMRRGVNLRFEDVFIFDQSGLFGRADLYDRHRDMRLDVDNMSYEELLALEERIGYVNTGLSEETILKCLRQGKYSACSLEVALVEQEPCCICREDYREGEEMGSLDCRHDFHAICIKQWLMVKNLCPICKTTALVT